MPSIEARLAEWNEIYERLQKAEALLKAAEAQHAQDTADLVEEVQRLRLQSDAALLAVNAAFAAGNKKA